MRRGDATAAMFGEIGLHFRPIRMTYSEVARHEPPFS
jgi:hypothetical protein